MDSATVDEARPRAGAPALVRAIPAWAWLAGIVGVSALLRYALGRRMAAPWIFVDELIYSELAKSFASTGHFLVRGEPTGAYGFVYPLLISPAYRAFAAVPHAYAAAKAINAVLMSLAAVPAYLLARRVLEPPLALVAAGLSVAVPSMLYTGTLMTENAFYPVFLCAALALLLTLDRPTPARVVGLFAVCGLAFATRAQAVALVPAVLTAPLLYAFFARRSLRDYRRLYGIAAGGAAVVVAAQLARGRGLTELLGAYRAAGDYHYSAAPVARWILYHVAELDLYLGIAPFAALLLLAALGRGLPARVQAFTAASLALAFWLVVEVGAFASLPTVGRVEERNMFYLAPLFLIALLVWIELGVPRPPRAAAVPVLAAAALPAALPFATLIRPDAVSDTFALLPWWWLQDRVITLGQVRLVASLCAVAVAILLVLVPRRFALVLPALVVACFAATAWTVEHGEHGIRRASLGALFTGIKNPHPDWIDRAVGRHADVAVLWTGKTTPLAIWENEFFNRSVGRVYDLGDPLPGGLAETKASVDRRSGLIRDAHGPVRARYALADGSVTLAGTPVAQDRRQGLVVYRVRGPLVSTTQVTGLYPNDTWSGARATYTRRRCDGGSVTVLLQSDPSLFFSQRVVARVAGRVAASAHVAASDPRELTVPLRPRGGRCTVGFTVSPTAVPARVLPGSTDARTLGIHFSRFTYAPPRG